MSTGVRAVLKANREKTARQHHPWIFSGAIEKIEGQPGPGDVIAVVDSRGSFVAYGHYSPASQIRIRLLEWDERAIIDESWLFEKIKASIDRRSDLAGLAKTNAWRLIYGESDGLPGLIIDRYNDFIIIQFLACGVDKIKNQIIEALQRLVNPTGIYERSDADLRKLEGLEPIKGPLAGKNPPDKIMISEYDIDFAVDVINGHKTGFYLDQRFNRRAAAEFARGRKVLDCFCYTGGFGLQALANQCRSLTLVDSSEGALDMARQNIESNGVDRTRAEIIEGDVFEFLREMKRLKRRYEMVILDPPKFAPHKDDIKKALAAYKDINLQAMQILEPGGILATFSCSGAVDSQTLQTVLFWAAVDSGREVQMVQRLSQDMDHPVSVTFPESEYLKGFICRVI